MHAPWVANPAVDAATARVDPQDVLEPKVLPQASVDDLNEHAFVCMDNVRAMTCICQGSAASRRFTRERPGGNVGLCSRPAQQLVQLANASCRAMHMMR